MSRNKFTRSSYDFVRGERVSWLDQFAEKINEASSKSAVEVARERNQQSIQDQINSIVNNSPSKPRTVEGVVKDLQERVGLKDYLQLVAKREQAAKTAQNHDSLLVGVDPSVQEDIKQFIRNKIQTHRGQISVPAIQNEVKSTFRNYGIGSEEVDTEKVARYISEVIAQEQSMNPSSLETTNLGKGVGVVDTEDDEADNNDFMKNMTPK